jgi:hypothetical protein
MSELKNVAPPDFIEGGFGGSYRRRHCEIMVIVLRLRVLFEIVRIGFYMVVIAGLIT